MVLCPFGFRHLPCGRGPRLSQWQRRCDGHSTACTGIHVSQLVRKGTLVSSTRSSFSGLPNTSLTGIGTMQHSRFSISIQTKPTLVIRFWKKMKRAIVHKMETHRALPYLFPPMSPPFQPKAALIMQQMRRSVHRVNWQEKKS